MPNPIGNPCKLTAESKARLLDAINKGATYQLACNYAGVDYSTYRRWMIRGEQEESGKYRDLYNDVKRAEGEAAFKWLSIIDAAAFKDWQAAAWKLERRYWEGYSKHTETIAMAKDMEDFKEKLNQGEMKNVKVNNGSAQENS